MNLTLIHSKVGPNVSGPIIYIPFVFFEGFVVSV